jgi:hypothetical protein
MTRSVPPGYTGLHDPTRDADQVMLDGTAQTLIREIIDLHQDLCRKLDADIQRAAHPTTEPASGYVTGSSDHDQMETLTAAVARAGRERDRQLKNAREELRRVKRYYEERLGLRAPRRPRVESVDYQDGGQRRVG